MSGFNACFLLVLHFAAAGAVASVNPHPSIQFTVESFELFTYLLNILAWRNNYYLGCCCPKILSITAVESYNVISIVELLAVCMRSACTEEKLTRILLTRVPSSIAVLLFPAIIATDNARLWRVVLLYFSMFPLFLKWWGRSANDHSVSSCQRSENCYFECTHTLLQRVFVIRTYLPRVTNEKKKML